MRNNLVTVFHCGDCGMPLEILYPDDAVKPDTSCFGMSPPLETGANIRMDRVSIKPCERCKEKYTRPLLDIARALNDISGFNK